MNIDWARLRYRKRVLFTRLVRRIRRWCDKVDPPLPLGVATKDIKAGEIIFGSMATQGMVFSTPEKTALDQLRARDRSIPDLGCKRYD